MNGEKSAGRELSVGTPAKVNLMLAVHGPREDGFHELTSLVAPLEFADDLTVRVQDSGSDRLTCSMPGVPVDGSNLVLKAAAAFRAATGKSRYYKFNLEKRIPFGAGLGGGSSNAAGALLVMNELEGAPLGMESLRGLAAGLGSDCPFFLEPRLCLMRGRGERLEAAPAAQIASLRGQTIILFKPSFGVGTAWAYGALRAEAPDSYAPESQTQRLLEADAKELIFNSFETVVSRKYRAINALLGDLRERGVVCGLSGSGSCCFALPEFGPLKKKDLKHIIKSAWGDSVFFIETALF